MPKKGGNSKSKLVKSSGNIAGGEKEEIIPPTAQEVLELVTARKKLERALQVNDSKHQWYFFVIITPPSSLFECYDAEVSKGRFYINRHKRR